MRHLRLATRAGPASLAPTSASGQRLFREGFYATATREGGTEPMRVRPSHVSGDFGGKVLPRPFDDIADPLPGRMRPPPQVEVLPPRAAGDRAPGLASSPPRDAASITSRLTPRCQRGSGGRRARGPLRPVRSHPCRTESSRRPLLDGRRRDCHDVHAGPRVLADHDCLAAQKTFERVRVDHVLVDETARSDHRRDAPCQ
jgi:hypothetical protein